VWDSYTLADELTKILESSNTYKKNRQNYDGIVNTAEYRPIRFFNSSVHVNFGQAVFKSTSPGQDNEARMETSGYDQFINTY